MSSTPDPTMKSRSGGPDGSRSGPPELFLFDFDGTVADTLEVSHRILNELAVEFRFRQLPPDELETARDMETRQFIRHLGISNWRVPRIARRGLQLLRSRIDSVDPVKGMPEVLAELHSRGHRIGILTSNSKENVAAFLGRHDLPWFHFVKTSSKLFGKSGKMKSILKAEGVEPGRALYVGDETRDIEAARETGLPVAAVTWGFNSTAALSALSPEHLVDEPAELLRIGHIPR